MYVVHEQDFRKLYQIQKFAERAIEKNKLIFPIKPNREIAEIVSFLTFDGHLTPNNKMFIFSAGSVKNLKNITTLVERQFGVKGKLKKVKTNFLGTSFEYRVCNQPTGRILEILGVPKGDKVLREFNVPQWVTEKKEFSYGYLRVAFFCEGSVWEEKNGRVQIAFKINKSKNLAKNGENFLGTLREMLRKWGIETTNIWSVKSNLRKDGNVTIGMQFRIKAESVNNFIRLFQFSKGPNDVGQTVGLHKVVV